MSTCNSFEKSDNMWSYFGTNTLTFCSDASCNPHKLALYSER